VQFPRTERKYDNLFSQELLEKPPIIHNEKSLHGKRGTLPALPCMSSFLDADLFPHAPTPNPPKQQLLQIPEKIRTSSSSWCFDIATPHHRRSSCFTHSYGKFIRGTGSILYTGPLSLGEGSESDTKEEQCKAVVGSCSTDNGIGTGDSNANNEKDGTTATTSIPSIDRFQLALPEERTFDASWSEDLDWDRHMRYFSGTEIARLMGFPVLEPLPPAIVCDDSTCPGKRFDDATVRDTERQQLPLFRKFSFPSSGCTTMKQQWKLLGNSLNVRVASCVAEIGIQSILNELGGDQDEI
jgi:tRNA (cytosine38-C5)-methyltransferase